MYKYFTFCYSQINNNDDNNNNNEQQRTYSAAQQPIHYIKSVGKGSVKVSLRFYNAERGYATVVVCLSACLSVTLRYDFHTGWNTWKIISRPNSLRYLLTLLLRCRSNSKMTLLTGISSVVTATSSSVMNDLK